VKTAVISAAFGEKYLRIAGVSFPTMKQYAERIGAEFAPLDHREHGEAHGAWEKLQLRELLEKHDRIIWLDVDMIVRRDTPDLFGIVPEGILGAVDETPGTFSDSISAMQVQCASEMGIRLGPPRWSWNAGVMVLSRCHKPIFDPPPKLFGAEYLWDQTYFNVRLRTLRLPSMDLGHKFNHTVLCLRPKSEAHIIHYCGVMNFAGYANMVLKGRELPDVMTEDLKLLGEA
jgi:lipopolysaccharide biosynthesis glycosyltransferase